MRACLYSLTSEGIGINLLGDINMRDFWSSINSSSDSAFGLYLIICTCRRSSSAQWFIAPFTTGSVSNICAMPISRARAERCCNYVSTSLIACSGYWTQPLNSVEKTKLYGRRIEARRKWNRNYEGWASQVESWNFGKNSCEWGRKARLSCPDPTSAVSSSSSIPMCMMTTMSTSTSRDEYNLMNECNPAPRWRGWITPLLLIVNVRVAYAVIRSCMTAM